MRLVESIGPAVLLVKKNTYALKTPSVVALPFIYDVEYILLSGSLPLQLSNSFTEARHDLASKARSELDASQNSNWEIPLRWLANRFWPMTLIYELDILPLDLHAKIQVCMSVCYVRRVRRTHRRTDTQTDTQCQNYYTLRWRWV